ncbi:MAG TPA: precorrin-8X methylmutase [Streptosporangiaceae bacterium]|nr:precorrin-8X methylmutase [Streptosporangiaceae bacterium]
MVGDPLEDEYRAVRSRVSLGGLPRLSRAVTERIICASGDLTFAADLACAEPALEAAVLALDSGAPVVADGPMVSAGIADFPVVCKSGESLTRRLARTAGIELAAAAVRLAFGEVGPGAVWVVGSEPVAIYEILARGTEPVLVIGMPAGFVAAVGAKAALRESSVPALTNVCEKGGPAAAVAGCRALLDEVRALRGELRAGLGS